MDDVAVDVFVAETSRNSQNGRDTTCHTNLNGPMERARIVLRSNFGFNEFRLSQAQVHLRPSVCPFDNFLRVCGDYYR